MSQVLFLSACVFAFCFFALTFGNSLPNLDEQGQSVVVTARDYDDCTQEEESLDPFIGKWVEINYLNLENESLDTAGIIGGAGPDFLLSIKIFIIYTRNNEMWTIEMGTTNASGTMISTFKLGEPYVSWNLDGTRLKSVVVQVGNTLVSHHESIKHNNLAMTLVREVHGDIMIMTALSDGKKLEIFFKKE